VSKRDWLESGLEVLSESGVEGLRIDRLSARLGLSKGSFYHHFAGISGYRLDLLDFYRQEHTGRHIRKVESSRDLDPKAKLDLLQTSIMLEDGSLPRLEVAIRAWAAEDDDARAALEQVDADRFDYLERLCLGFIDDPEQARVLSRMLYLMLIGSQHVAPPVPFGELRRMYAAAIHAALVV